MSREPLMPDEDLLSAYLDGECTEAERGQVEQQLATSAETRAVMADLTFVRDAVRALPLRDASPQFWATVLDAEPVSDDAGSADVVDLEAAGRRRRPSRWLAGAVSATAAAVIAAVVLVPTPQSVTPPVAAFTDAHAVRTSLQDDALSSLAPLAVAAGFRR